MNWPEALGLPALILAIFLGEAAQIWAAGQSKKWRDDDDAPDDDAPDDNPPKAKP